MSTEHDKEVVLPRAERVALIVLDGFGLSEDEQHNAIARAHTPYIESLKTRGIFGRVNANGSAVGLPEGQLSGSEVGHMVLGAGRVIPTMIEVISHAIESGSLSENENIRSFFSRVREKNGTVHLVGLTSEAGVHARLSHGLALAYEAHKNGIEKIAWHAFTDGRDCPPHSAHEHIERVERTLQTYGGKIVTLCGRSIAMDRNNNTELTERAFQLIINGEGEKAESWESALTTQYALGKSDEFITPTLLPGYEKFKEGDGIIFFNFRTDRMRQLSARFCRGDNAPGSHALIAMTRYSDDVADIPVIFPEYHPPFILGECLARAGKSQLRAAETEKYPHVTFFFNGGVETVFEKEERILIPSPSVPTYDMKPEMSAHALTDAVVDAVRTRMPDCVIMNYANADMVGHTGNLEATIIAIETLDHCLQRLVPFLWKNDYCVLITADHGNAEEMFDHNAATHHTAHTFNDVPGIIAFPDQSLSSFYRLYPHATLADFAPTILSLLGLNIPQEMTGHNLIVHKDS